MRKKMILVCTVCHNRNYQLDKAANATTRLEVKKFCKHCNKHTVHKETK
jgi:large subunit ribosomal protein L33